ncbi:MAG: Rpn family recombination-promoting nuclease/putative transposase [Burkholderiales bacterium]
MPIRPDTAYKLLFSTPEIVRDLVTGFIHDPWLRSLDLDTLEKVPAEFIGRRLRRRASDVIWRVRTGAADDDARPAWAYLYLLVEFQSRSDRWMALRVLAYVALLWQDLLRREGFQGRARLPPILPVVVYNGLRPWRAATEIGELIAPVSPGLARYLPRMQYLLIDQARFDETQLSAMRNLMAAVMRLDRPAGRESLLSAVADLRALVAGTPRVQQVFSEWIQALFAEHPVLADSADIDLQERDMGLRETLRQWEREFLAQGRQEGRQEGEALLLQRQLARRFGPLPPAVVERIASATPAQLEQWGDRVLDAASLEAVFAG